MEKEKEKGKGKGKENKKGKERCHSILFFVHEPLKDKQLFHCKYTIWIKF